MRFLSLKSSLIAGAVALSLSGIAAWAQGYIGAFQNGVNSAPSVYGVGDPTSGFYFGSGRVGFAKHLESGQGVTGTVPVLSACGTGTLAGNSTDSAGEFTATGATGCTLTFGTAYAAAPTCVVTEETVNTATRTTTVTASTLVVASGGSGSKYSYVCIGKSGG